jgi:hypothetical protein
MEAARTSETSVDNHFTRQYNPEDSSEHHTRRRENLKSHIVLCICPISKYTVYPESSENTIVLRFINLLKRVFLLFQVSTSRIYWDLFSRQMLNQVSYIFTVAFLYKTWSDLKTVMFILYIYITANITYTWAWYSNHFSSLCELGNVMLVQYRLQNAVSNVFSVFCCSLSS